MTPILDPNHAENNSNRQQYDAGQEDCVVAEFPEEEKKGK